ncbi:MAG: phospholipase A [Azoarcus sp.]|jgi:outer membrane phospholipase A|nr:phospholipase A [Azoarcus sp.]
MRALPHPPFFAVALTALLLTVPAAVHAADWLLAAPEPRVAPGQAFEVVVVGEPGADGWPASLPALLILPNNGPRLQITLTATDELAPSRQRYIGQWPDEITGLATLALADVPTARLLVEATALSPPPVSLPLSPPPGDAAPADIAAAPEGIAAVPPAADIPTTSLDADLVPAVVTADAPAEPTALGFNEPIYIVYGGTHPKSVRYQLSFRYRVFDRQGLVSNIPVIGGLYFAYTQMAMWDVESESKPFRDTNLRPSIYLQWKATDPLFGDSLTLAGGYEHESNGRDGPDSRSIDTWFARADLRYYLPDKRTYIGIEPKLWSYIDKEDNPDIQKYRGHGQLGLRIGRDSALMLTTILRRGTAGKGSTQFDLSYPIRRSIFSGVGTFLHVQYFNGYGQTMLEYNQSRHPQIRVGLSLVR